MNHAEIMGKGWRATADGEVELVYQSGRILLRGGSGLTLAAEQLVLPPLATDRHGATGLVFAADRLVLPPLANDRHGDSGLTFAAQQLVLPPIEGDRHGDSGLTFAAQQLVLPPIEGDRHGATGLTLDAEALVLPRLVANLPPVWAVIPPQTVGVGTSIELDLSAYASDPDGDALTFSVVSAGTDVDASVIGATLAITGEVLTTERTGTEIEVVADDGRGGMATVMFTVHVGVVGTACVSAVIGDFGPGQFTRSFFGTVSLGPPVHLPYSKTRPSPTSCVGCGYGSMTTTPTP